MCPLILSAAGDVVSYRSRKEEKVDTVGMKANLIFYSTLFICLSSADRCCLSKCELKECQSQNIEKPLLVIDLCTEDEWGGRQYSRGQINECTF